MTFPLWYILLPYAAVLLVAALFLFFNLFHLMRYGLEANKTYALMGLYVASFCVVLGLTAFLFSSFDWTSNVSLSDIVPVNTSSSHNYGL